MFHSVKMIGPSIAILVCTPLFATAQDICVYTQVRDLSGNPNNPEAAPTISRSRTLFHAGRVYDYVDGVGELIVYDPAHQEFIIVDGIRMLVTTVQFDEIKHLLKLNRQRAGEYLDQLREKGDADSLKAIRPLEFQLHPVFNETLNLQAKPPILNLSSEYFQYSIRCVTNGSPELGERFAPESIQRYLEYADWVARLNYVLHPHFFPELRLAVNESLRRRNLLPIAVDLKSQFEGQHHLRAEHRFYWELEDQDRSYINQWERLLVDPDFRHVSFNEYHRRTLVSQTSIKR